MSSSVFIESCVQPLKGATGAESESAISGYPDSNLVVVYGKSGVNFDQRGIENLIEEKTLSSISVIRLTSPTPSMIDEEQEAEKTEELLRRQAEGISDDSNDSSTRNSSSVDECAEHTESEELPTADDEKSDECENLVDNGKLENRKQKRKNRRKSRISAKVHNTPTKLHKERPDIVGLTIEEFYPPVTAKEVVKEALKLAGVPTFKHTADYEFQMFVIKNDHCYTPFTSPAQMKTKLAEKYKAEKHAIIGRKIIPIPHTAITMKQIQLKKKVFQNMNDIVDPSTMQSGKDLSLKLANKNSEISKKTDIDELLEDDAELQSLTAESEIDVVSEESGDTDNDRDSDLDFDVNNRKGRKKKDLVTKAKRLSAGKVYVKRQLQTQDELDDPRSKNIRPVQSTITNRSNKVGVLATKVAGGAPIAVQKLLSDAVAALPPIPKRSAASLLEDKPINTVVRQQTIPSNVRRGPIIEVGMQKTPSARTQLQSSPQSVKEIAINKVMASPKGGFTEIGELLYQAEKKTPTKALPTTPTSSLKSPAVHAAVSPSPSKGFMPLGIETAARNKLPAQISIQTHQSSSELAAKNKVCVDMEPLNDISPSNRETQLPQKEEMSSELAAEHFDLIVSIVKDEMQKTDLIKVTSKPNDNIPKLVKMLQNAEHTLESNNLQAQTDKSLSTFDSNADSTVDGIDISNAPLLDSTEADEIPEDLLQHVVDLIGDDETLHEAVQNQVFGGENNEAVLSGRSDEVRTILSSTATRSIPTTAIQMQTTQSEVNQPKSIIEMAISNIPSTPMRETNSANNVPIRGTSVQTTRSPLIRKEPIQIIRGNGRVITLPPIEAPTTRAKRRAQNQPISVTPSAMSNSNTILVDSSLDSSLQSNSSFNVLGPIHPLVENKKEQTNKRRVSKESASAGATTKAKRSSAKKSNAAKNIVNKTVVEDEAAGSQEDDDDPNKLWCICRQPHNNRFMICCDVCEDWFHGTCVSITKAMGIEMEQKGIDWTCPKCIKLQEAKSQRKITDMLIPKNSTSNTSFAGNEKCVFEIRDNTSAASNIEAVTGSIVDSSTNRSYMQKSDKLNIKQNIETNKTQSYHLTPINPLLKRPSGAVKTASSSQKKKQSSNGKNKNSNVSISQSKRRIPISEQLTAMTHISGSQQTIKNMQKPPGSEPIPADEHTLCIVCKKVARQNSIYCSDDCIRKHAQNALNIFAAASAAKPPEPPIIVSVNEEMSAKKKKSKGLFEDLLLMADRKPKVERVNVIERKTGRVLTGSNAPTTLNLKKWLQDNQTFEVVQPGSFQAQEIEKRQKQRQPQSLSPVLVSSAARLTPQTPQNTASTMQSVNVTPVTKATNQPQREHESSPQVQKPPVKQLVEQIVKTAPNSPRPGTPKLLQKYPQQVSIKPDKGNRTDSKEESKEKKEKSSKQRSSVESVAKRNPESVTPTNTSSEPIRINVRRTFKEQLLQRMNEPDSENKNDSNLSKLSLEEVEKFSLETEAEMYEYFSRDTGSRYRAKYRSLMFNIKDRKNHTLFAKICAKQIQPKQLVRMSPEELASQELAKWRENETKHQLEMIKKSELDLLSCTKNYVLKTHKGEEVIEGKSEDCVSLDVTIPVEDVVSVLNSAVVSSSSTIDDKVKDVEPNALSFDHSQNIESSEIQSTKITNRSDEIKQKMYPQEKDSEPERLCEKDRNRDHGRDRDREHYHIRARSPESDRSREKQKKNRDKARHRDKSRSRKRSRSHSRSRSRSREKRHKSHHRDEKREKEERDREKDRYKEKERDRDRDSRSLKDELDKKAAEKSSLVNFSFAFNPNKSNNTIINIKDKNILKKSTTTKPIESFSLIDQILESTKTVEEAANLISEKEKLREKERNKEKQKQNSGRQAITPPLPSSSIIKYTSEPNFSNDDQEPTSTVSIATPPQDPYIRYADAYSPNLGENISSMVIWSGNINMVDVASFQIVLQPVVGNSVNIVSLLPDELDVVGRIGPDTVWEYISKIKRSPNKEIVIIRLIPASESETAAYTVLFQYLENRNRLGVISTASPQIKDFYIYPLGAGKSMPAVLQPTEKVDFYEDPYRPDILVGVLVRIVGKRHSTTAPLTTSSMQKSYRRGTDTDTFTPPGSPKRKRRIHTSTPKVEQIDLDAIIKAPITIKANKSPTVALTTNDADEPYSPGGSSDDDALLKTTDKSDDDELKRKMDELNRQIAAQEKEIAGLLNVESSCFATTSPSKTSAVLANISIPSNLSQILASIKNKPENSTVQVQLHQSVSVTKTRSNVTVDEEYNPEMALCETSGPKGKVSSRLAQLSEAELLSMVPDGMMETPTIAKTTQIKSRFEEPPPPGV